MVGSRRERQEGVAYDPGTVQGPRDGGDPGASLRGGGAGDRGAGEDRVWRVSGSLQVALCADLVHRLRAEDREGGRGLGSQGCDRSLPERRLWRLARVVLLWFSVVRSGREEGP